MSKDLNLSAAEFGGAAGIFFIAYFFFEVPSNLALDRFGARLWIARIMTTWGLITGAQAFVVGKLSLNIVRLLLGIAEAGFFPGIIFFLTLWFPAAYRARVVGLFMFAIPISTVIGAPISGFILDMEGVAGLQGWQWMFIIEAIPALLTGVVVLYYLTDRPRDAHRLKAEESRWLEDRLEAERANREQHGALSWFRSMLDPRVIALGFVYMGCNIPQ
jgi:MFS family permease